MRNLIRRWLGIDLIASDVITQEHELETIRTVIKAIKDKPRDEWETNNLIEQGQLLGSIIDFLDLDVERIQIRDRSRIEATIPTVPVLSVKKRKK